LAWELDLMDLKKLCINGIKYSSIPEEKRNHLLTEVFPHSWNLFIATLKNVEVEKVDPPQ
jgi:adenosine deaminase